MFDQPLFQRVRCFIPWNAMSNPGQLAAADAYRWQMRRLVPHFPALGA